MEGNMTEVGLCSIFLCDWGGIQLELDDTIKSIRFVLKIDVTKDRNYHTDIPTVY